MAQQPPTTRQPTTRFELERKQARATADMVADAIAGRKLGFLNDHSGPVPQPQSVSGYDYGGYNAIVVEAFAAKLGTDSPQFGTAAQFRQLGFRIREGERGVSLVGSTRSDFRVVTDEEGQPIIKGGRMVREMVTLDRPRPASYLVYSASQVEPVDPKQESELPEPKQAARNPRPLQAASRLADEMGVPIRRADSPYLRATADGIRMPSSEAIGNRSTEAREIVRGVASWLRESGTLHSGSRNFAWKPALTTALTAHRVGQKLGIGSRTLRISDQQLEHLAGMVRQWPERLLAASRDAAERHDYMTKDAPARTRLRNASADRVRRLEMAREGSRTQRPDTGRGR